MKIGVLGGTFDPPHLAHLILAAEASYQLGLETVLWVVTPDPPHKGDRILTPASHRVDMVAAAIAGNPSFQLSRVDLDRPAPHFTVETINILTNQFPGAALIYLMGGDSLRDLPTWHDPNGFLKGCHVLGVMRRPGVKIELTRLESQLPALRAKVRFIETPQLDISATEIRRRIAAGEPFRYFLLEVVYQLIQARGLYKA